MSVFFINPFSFAIPDGDYESIATITVGSGGTATIDFTSIPSTYQHLQIRMIGKSTLTTADYHFMRLRVNGATGSVYSFHSIYTYGNGTVFCQGLGSRTSIFEAGQFPDSNAARASMFGPTIIDILDYANTSKNTTIRIFSGVELNSTISHLHIASGLYQATTAVSSLNLSFSSGNFAQHTTAALYGIKAP